MNRILVLFSSKNEEYIYSEVLAALEREFTLDFEVLTLKDGISDLQSKIAANNYRLVLAGGGHSALLPGVCAALTDMPVFGIPVATNFGGLDSLLSMLQMPEGLPLAVIAPRNIESLKEFLGEVKHKNSRKVNIVASRDIENYEYYTQEFTSLKKMALQLGIEISKSNVPDSELMNIVLVHSGYDLKTCSSSLYVPLLAINDKNSPAFSLRVLELVSGGGIWFGINSSSNALQFLSKFLIS